MEQVHIFKSGGKEKKESKNEKRNECNSNGRVIVLIHVIIPPVFVFLCVAMRADVYRAATELQQLCMLQQSCHSSVFFCNRAATAPYFYVCCYVCDCVNLVTSHWFVCSYVCSYLCSYMCV